MIDPRHPEWMRRKLEAVFDLSPGQISTEEWAGNMYWYEDVPYHADQSPGEYRTLLMDCSDQEPPEIEGWHWIETYPNPGTADCDFGDKLISSKEAVADGKCALCENHTGQRHGMIYIGSGWCEILYEQD